MEAAGACSVDAAGARPGSRLAVREKKKMSPQKVPTKVPTKCAH